VAEPLKEPVILISTIFVDPKILKGVVAGAPGFSATGTTVTAVGTVPPKFSFVPGSAPVAEINAVVAPKGIVATLEFGSVPADICGDVFGQVLVLPPSPALVKLSLVKNISQYS
jgi:hypothetical protein